MGKNYRVSDAFTDPELVGPTGNPYIRDGLVRTTDAQGVERDLGWDAVGKTALGGLDTDPSGRFLYTVALGDRKLYVIDLANPTVGLQSIDLPSPASVTGKSVVNPQGDLRPFAVQFYRGSIYVGAVNSGESTISSTNPRGDSASLRAYVFQFRLAVDNSGALTTGGGQFVDTTGAATATTPVLDIALNYGRGYTQVGAATASDVNDPNYTGAIPADWNVWTPTFKTLTDPQGPIRNIGIYPQPMLTGLAFDTAGNVTLGIRDRAGDQFAVQTPSDPLNKNNLYTGITAGDTLKAFYNGVGAAARWTLENNGSAPGGTLTSQAGVGNGQGPGGGEFYSDDYLIPGVLPNQQDHQELSTGGVLQLANYGELASTVFDPAQISNRVNTGGVRWFDNAGANAGGAARAFELYRSTVNFEVLTNTFAKSNGIGDLVAITSAPTEIGNRVWADLNRDGQQGAAEPGLAGVQVVLYKDGVDAPLATATTDAAGNYYFTSMALPVAAGAGAGQGLRRRPADAGDDLRGAHPAGAGRAAGAVADHGQPRPEPDRLRRRRRRGERRGAGLDRRAIAGGGRPHLRRRVRVQPDARRLRLERPEQRRPLPGRRAGAARRPRRVAQLRRPDGLRPDDQRPGRLPVHQPDPGPVPRPHPARGEQPDAGQLRQQFGHPGPAVRPQRVRQRRPGPGRQQRRLRHHRRRRGPRAGRHPHARQRADR